MRVELALWLELNVGVTIMEEYLETMYVATLVDMLGNISPFQWHQIQHIHPGQLLKLWAKPPMGHIVKARERVVPTVQLTTVVETIVGELARHVGVIRTDGQEHTVELLDAKV